MTEFVALKAKTYAYLIDDNNEHKKAKGTKKCVIKGRLMFKNYTDCLFYVKTMLQSQQRFKSDCDNVYTEQINKIILSSNEDKRLQTFDKITTYPYRMEQNPKVSFEEIININDQFWWLHKWK